MPSAGRRRIVGRWKPRAAEERHSVSVFFFLEVATSRRKVLLRLHYCATAANAVARVVVELAEFKGAWVARRVDEPSGDVLFVRKSSLRDKAQWTALRAGSRVSLTIKVVSGRGIVSDAVLESGQDDCANATALPRR